MTSPRTAVAALAVAFIATVWASNWLLARYGFVQIGWWPAADGWRDLVAPAGVFTAGLAFGLRDALHELAGRVAVLLAIVAGAALTLTLPQSTFPGGPSTLRIALASGAAFLVSELADFAVYEPLRERHWQRAVVLSNAVGSVVDSALFLWLAFGSLVAIEGQLVGKVAMIVPAIPLVAWVRRRALPRNRVES